MSFVLFWFLYFVIPVPKLSLEHTGKIKQINGGFQFDRGQERGDYWFRLYLKKCIDLLAVPTIRVKIQTKVLKRVKCGNDKNICI